MLEALSILYLAVPWLIFAWGWLWWPYAAAVWSILAVAIVLSISRPRPANDLPPPTHRRWGNPAIVAASTLVLLGLSGVGGLGSQHSDWQKHNAILHDLTVRPWPVHYDGGAKDPRNRSRGGRGLIPFSAGGDVLAEKTLAEKMDLSPSSPSGERLKDPPDCRLTYYLAYYLPAAVAGRAFGLTAAHLSLAAWTYAGLLITAAWLSLLVGTRSWLVWGVWFLLSGMDALGMLFRLGGPPVAVEWWAGVAQYSANWTLLACVPQHALGGWIATAVIVSRAEHSWDMSHAGFVAALTGLWSPFVTIGLVPIAVTLAYRARLRTALSFANLVAAPLVLFVAVTYLASVPIGRLPNHWNFAHGDSGWFAVALPVFWALEFGTYALLLTPYLREATERQLPGSPWNRAWMATSVTALLLIPLYRVGLYNDFAMRASIPVLFLFWVVLLRVVWCDAFRRNQWQSALLVVCLLVGAALPCYRLVKQIARAQGCLQYHSGTAQASIPDLDARFLPQYLGRSDAFFYTHLARPSPAVWRRGL